MKPASDEFLVIEHSGPRDPDVPTREECLADLADFLIEVAEQRG